MNESSKTGPDIRRKLCYVLVKYEARTDRHYYHLYSFIEELARELDLRLIIAQAHETPHFSQVSSVRVCPDNRNKRWWLFREIWRAYREGYRFFYCHYTFGPAIFASLLTRLLGGRTYFWHCIMLDVLLREHNVSLYSPGFLLFRWGSMFIQTLVTGSDFMKQHYHRLFRIPLNRIMVLPNYLDLERFSPGSGQRDLYRTRLNLPVNKQVVLFVHGLEKGKGGTQLVSIARIVTDSVPDVLFVVVGDGSERSVIEQEITASNLESSFVLYGSVPNQNIPLYYKAADLFIMPSLYEEFSRTLLEAMAAGVPFVASDGRGGTYSYTSAKQHDFIVPSGNASLFAQKVITLLRSETLRQELVEEGLAHVQQFSQDAVRRRFIRQFITERPQDGPGSSGQNQSGCHLGPP